MLFPHTHPFPNITRATLTHLNMIHFIGLGHNDKVRMAGMIGYYVTEIAQSFLADSTPIYTYFINYAMSLCNPMDLPQYNMKLGQEIVTYTPLNCVVITSLVRTRKEFNGELMELIMAKHDKFPSWAKTLRKTGEISGLCVQYDTSWSNEIDHRFINAMREKKKLIIQAKEIEEGLRLDNEEYHKTCMSLSRTINSLEAEIRQLKTPVFDNTPSPSERDF